MAKMISEEEARKIMIAAGVIPSVPYKNGKSPWPGTCLTCGNEVSPRLNNIKNGSGPCGYCAGNKMTPEDAERYLREAGAEPLIPYQGSRVPWKSRCLRCRRIIYPMLGNAKYTGKTCVYCAPNAPVGWHEACEDVISAGFEPIGPYLGVMTPFPMRCRTCGGESSPNLNSIRKGSRCSNCAKYGFKSGSPAILYVARSEQLASIKVGISGNPGNRIKSLGSLGWTPILILEFSTGAEAKSLESSVLTFVRKVLKVPPHLTKDDMGGIGGWTETMSKEKITEDELISIINDFSSEGEA